MKELRLAASPWWLIGMLMAVMLSPSEARAGAVTDANGNVVQPFQAWADLASKRGLPTPDVTVDANDFGCPGLEDTRACVFMNSSDIHVCTIGCDMEQLSHVFWHELGHVFSFVSYRNVGFAFQRIMNDRRKWREGVGPPIERFAEAYALCAANPRRLPKRVQFAYDYMPSDSQHIQVCEMLQRQVEFPMYPMNNLPTHQNIH